MQTPDVPGISDLQLHNTAGGTVIYRGRQADADVAVKVFGDFSFVERDKFTRQWRVSGLLNGLPGIADVHEGAVGSDGKPYVVRAFVDGKSMAEELSAAIPHGDLEIAGVVHHLTAIADIVAYGHRNGVIHGALKPTNIFRGPDGAPVITDFGVPGLTDHGAERTLDDSALPYVAPEVRDGAASTQAADVYALGAMLYASLAGAPPSLDGVDANTDAIAGVPSEVMRSISAALSTEAKDRPRSAALFAQSLRRAVPKVPGFTSATASKVSPTEIVTPPVASPPVAETPAVVVEPKAEPITPRPAPVAPAAVTSNGGPATAAASASRPAQASPAPAPAPPEAARPKPDRPAQEPAAPIRLESQPPPLPARGTRPGPTPKSYGSTRASTEVSHAAADGPNLRRWALIGAAALIASVLFVGLAWNFLIDLTSADTVETPIEVASDSSSDTVATTDDPDAADSTSDGDTSDTGEAAIDSDDDGTANSPSDDSSEPLATPEPSVTATATDSAPAAPTQVPDSSGSTSLAPVATLPAAPAPSTDAESPDDGADADDTTGNLEATDDGLQYTGPRFAADLPTGWQAIAEDRDVGYGYRTRFDGPDNDFLYVDLTPPSRHDGQETIEESAYRIADQVSSSGPVYKLTIGSKVTYWFEYVGNDGSQRIDVFFTIGDTGYAVVGGSHDDPADAYRALIKFIDSLEQV